jgi:hypothetical protein
MVQKINEQYNVHSTEGDVGASWSFETYVFDRPRGIYTNEPWISFGVMCEDESKVISIFKVFVESGHLYFGKTYKLIWNTPTNPRSN